VPARPRLHRQAWLGASSAWIWLGLAQGIGIPQPIMCSARRFGARGHYGRKWSNYLLGLNEAASGVSGRTYLASLVCGTHDLKNSNWFASYSALAWMRQVADGWAFANAIWKAPRWWS